MKNLLTCILLLLTGIATETWAQQGPPPGVGGRGGLQKGPSITGKISGELIDSTTNLPVEFATVVLIDTKSKKELDGTITDDKGKFVLQNVKLGKYELHFSFLGYKPKSIAEIELTPEKPDYQVASIPLSPEGVLLAEVEVTGRAAVVENRIDKLVYNADKDVTSVGGDASNVLQKVPLLSVDADGNVSLRGSSNIQILINGKPSTLFSSNPADALRTIPADQIKSVEVITNPTAKYDGEGSGGIVNIITKKRNVEGFTGSVNGSVGNRQNRGSLNLSLVRGRFGLNFNGSGWYNPNRPSFSEYFRVDQVEDQERVLEQFGKGDSEFYGPRANLGMFYDLNAYNSISSSVSFRGFGRNADNVTDATYTDPILGLNQVYTRISNAKSLNSGFDWNTDYKRTFKRPEQELTIGFQLDMEFSDAENSFNQSGNEQSLAINNFNENLGVNSEITAQLDYVHPLGKAVKMETGAKGILRHIKSDFFAENFDFALAEFVRDPNASDVFFYDQNVFSGYLSFNMKLGQKIGLIVGSRYEYTDIAGDYDFDETTFSNAYNNFLPNAILSYSLSQMSSIKAAYNKRIRRPGLRFVNPYVNQSDPRDIEFGNPELLPEITNQFELNYSTFVKGIVLNTSVFYRVTTESIESFLVIDESGISRNTFLNIGETRSVGASMFTSINIKEKLVLRGSATVSTYDSESVVDGIALSRTSVIWNGNLNGTLSLKKGFKVEAFGFYNSPRQSIQGYRASFSMLSFGVLKEFNKKFSMGINVVQPFSRDLEFRNRSEGTNFLLTSLNAVAQRSIGLNVNYRFGKLDFRPRGERGQRNNDLKNDEDGGMNGGTRGGR